MSKEVGSTKRWDTMHLALYGALLGIFVGMVEQFCHAFCLPFWPQISGDDLFAHILIEVVAFALAGASLLAAISAIRNWFMRQR
jgi:hypothetical protein